jgi:hypothetical protein
MSNSAGPAPAPRPDYREAFLRESVYERAFKRFGLIARQNDGHEEILGKKLLQFRGQFRHAIRRCIALTVGAHHAKIGIVGLAKHQILGSPFEITHA